MKSIAENLVLLDVPRTVAQVIEVLADNKPHSMHEIEREADTRQPNVCVAVKMLEPYVTIESRKGVGKGRPQKYVTMTRKAYVEYVKACVLAHKYAYDVAKKAGEELVGK